MAGEVWEFSLTGVDLGKIFPIAGGFYLAVGQFNKLRFTGMSFIAFRRFDGGTYALTAFHEGYLKGVKAERQLTDEEFIEYLKQVDEFLERHRAWLARCAELSNSRSSGTACWR